MSYGEGFSQDAEARTILDAGTATAEADFLDEEQTGLMATYIVPDGYKIENVDLEAMREKYRGHPTRQIGTVHVNDVNSFIGYFMKHGNEDSEVWVSERKVIGVLDAPGPGLPGWGQHWVVLDLQSSSEWTRWINISGDLMGQTAFADFLEANAINVVDPDMATMLEVAKSLEATKNVDFKSAYRTQDGQRGFKYVETNTAKAGQAGDLEIPSNITLALRVFQGMPPQDVSARFLYRMHSDGLTLGIVIDRAADIVEDAITDVKDRLDMELPFGTVFAGAPQ